MGDRVRRQRPRCDQFGALDLALDGGFEERRQRQVHGPPGVVADVPAHARQQRGPDAEADRPARFEWLRF